MSLVTPDWAIILHFKDVKTDPAITPDIFTMVLLDLPILKAYATD